MLVCGTLAEHIIHNGGVFMDQLYSGVRGWDGDVSSFSTEF